MFGSLAYKDNVSLSLDWSHFQLFSVTNTGPEQGCRAESLVPIETLTQSESSGRGAASLRKFPVLSQWGESAATVGDGGYLPWAREPFPHPCPKLRAKHSTAE